MKLSLVLFTFLSFSLAISTAFARADVSLRNGNFFATFRDISFPGGMEPKVERVYNSKSDFSGIFGYGWGIEYETNLRFDPDGSLIISPFGGGAPNRFVAKNYKASDLEQGVNQMVEAAKKLGMFSTEKTLQDYKKKLTNDFEFRAVQYSMLANKGVVPRKIPVEGAQYTSTHYFYQYITKVKGGYVQVLDAGNVHKYNEAGKLVQIMDRNKNFINFSYDKNGRLVQLIDNQNRKMVFSYNQLGLVEKIVGESGKTASYRYGADRMLVYSKDDKGVENTFKYTQDRYHNLVELGYLNDKDAKGQPRKMLISYYPVEKSLNVKSVVNPDGTFSDYEYIKDPKKPEYFGVHVLLKEAGGARISDAKYEYFTKIRAGGEPFNARMISTVDGEKTETVYDEKLGFPVKVTNNGRTTTMDYDQKGRMTKKVTPIETTELSYDPNVGKVNKVVRKLKSGTVLWSAFEYDKANGNLVLAKNHENKTVKLIYDANGRIRALVDQTGRQLTFKYNEHSKPIEIADAKSGTVKFTYKNSGEVDKVESNGGANVATEVMRTLQSLIDITAPSGVSMGI